MKLLTTIIATALITASLFAAKFDVMKKKEIQSLTIKQEMIQKRLQCIKDAKTSKELRNCKKKYSLVKRKKKSVKRKMKNTRKAVKNLKK